MLWREFHNASKNRFKKDTLPASEVPPSWRTVYYKEYGRLPIVQLPPPREVSLSLGRVIAGRTSYRGGTREGVSLIDLSTLLKYSCGIQAETRDAKGELLSQHRAQSSAGGRYPIEAYLLSFVDGDIKQGIYHYDVRNHALRILKQEPFSKEQLHELFKYEQVGQASCVIVLTGVFKRSCEKYGERGYRYTMLEAGHVAQNVSLVGVALSLGVCLVGGFADEKCDSLLSLDGITESSLVAISLSRK